jgi:hypothetical protein
LSVDLTSTKTIDSVVFSGSCTSSAAVTVHVLNLAGLGDFVLNNLPVVEGTQNLDFSLFQGLSWDALFNVEGSFPDGLYAVVDVEISADACGLPIQESISGIVNIADASLRMTTSASGSAPGIFSLARSRASVSLTGGGNVELGSLSTSMDFGNGIELDLTEVIGSVLGANDFMEQIAAALVAVLNGAFSGLTFDF